MTLTDTHTLYPDYLYHYPCFKKVQIAAVKRQIFHPNLPTLRAMDRDTVLCKLPDEHCQSTTCCTLADFSEANVKGHRLPRLRIVCPDVTETAREPSRVFNSSRDIQKGFSLWSQYLDSPSLFTDRPEDRLLHKRNYDPNALHFNGHQIKPQVVIERNIRMTLRSEPRLDHRGQQQQQPTPSEIKSRYRHEYPVFYRDMSSQPWYSPSPRPQHHDPPLVRIL
ncbi:unnamed protein product [Candidula unifasciata]|uniref:Uncharacterized protein n=1 Tax=Candidula unifasciata TaxID=100452 RepID=A0A8S4A0X2_9EUPU|nr:unnamed protein product [Candidula unifasciata]